MTEKEVIKIFINIEKYNYKKIDGMILACAMRLVYRAGLQKNEIPLLRIGDVFDQQRKVRTATIKRNITIPLIFHTKLKRYYSYLNTGRYSTTPASPLFPGYYSTGDNQENELKKIGLHLKKIDSGYNTLIHNLHEFGINNFHHRYAGANAMADTAKQFRITERSVQDSIKGKITPHGKAPLKGANLLNHKQLEHVEKLDTLDCANIEKIKDAIEACYDDYYSLPDKGLKRYGQDLKKEAFDTYRKLLLRKVP
jgi:integrase